MGFNHYWLLFFYLSKSPETLFNLSTICLASLKAISKFQRPNSTTKILLLAGCILINHWNCWSLRKREFFYVIQNSQDLG